MSDREGLAELLTEAEWRECVSSFAYFCERFWMIQTPQGARTFELRAPQLEGFRAFEDHKLVITLKARQIGWTTLCAAYVFWKAFFRPDWTCIFLSRGEREAVSIMRMVDYGYRRLPEWMRARGPRRMSEAQERFPLDNGSLIESLPSKKDPARGRTVNLVIVDEWAFLENAEEAWASIEPITDIGGRLIGLSTANGAGNFFHRLWQRAESGHSTFKAIFFPWSAVPDRDEAWYEQKRRDMLEWQLHQEYPTTPEEAFIKSGNPVFDIDLLRSLPTADATRGYLTRYDSKRARWSQHRDGNLRVWQEPEANDSYVIGADVAEGLEHGDYSSAHVIGIRSQRVVAAWHGHVDPDLFGDVLADLGWWYGTALLGVEANNHGHSTLAQLKRLHYRSLYYQWTYDERTRSQGRKIGWRTTKVTKPLMVDELAMELRNGSLSLADESTIRELMTYVRDERGGTSGSPFDDRVVSLAIANQMRKHAAAPEYREHLNDYMTMDWWARTQTGDRDVPQRIGSRQVSKLASRVGGRRYR